MRIAKTHLIVGPNSSGSSSLEKQHWLAGQIQRGKINSLSRDQQTQVDWENDKKGRGGRSGFSGDKAKWNCQESLQINSAIFRVSLYYLRVINALEIAKLFQLPFRCNFP